MTAARLGEPEARVRASFARQGLMSTLGATLGAVGPGEVEIFLPVAPAVSQQHGFVHAGAVASIADSAAGYAALTLMPETAGVLSVEFKINLVAPAKGERLVARAKVLKSGRTLTLVQTDVFAEDGTASKLVAHLVATMMRIEDRPGIDG